MVASVVEVGEADSEIAVGLVIVVEEVAIAVDTVEVVEGVAEEDTVIVVASVVEEVVIEEDTVTVVDEAEVVVHHSGIKFRNIYLKVTKFTVFVFLRNSDRGRDRSRPY